MSNPRPTSEFDDALLALIDGSTDPTDTAALDDPDARRRYLDLVAAQVLIVELLEESKSESLDLTPTVEPTPGNAPLPVYLPGCEPQPFKLRPHHVALAAAALLAACGLAAYLLTASIDPKPDPVDPNQSPPPVATLIHNTGNLRTPHGYPAEGDDYGQGEYALDTGTAEFMLTNSVNVKLRGSTRMSMHNDMNVALTQGSAEFVCPKDAKGFTVHLPDKSRVVDLGTAFKVEIDDEGQPKLRVTEGSVEWFPAGADAEPVLIAAGQRARLVEGRPVVVTPADLLADADAALVAHWEFDNADDIGEATVGSDLHAVADAAYTADGRVGGALLLDGVDDYLRVDDSHTLPVGLPTGDGSYTVAVWIKPADTGDRGIVGWGAYKQPNRVNALRLDDANGILHYWWVNDLTITGETVAETDVRFADGGWVHLAVTWDGTTRRLYLNGQPIAQDTPNTPDVAAETFTLGVTNKVEFFHGLIDDVRIYNTALAHDEIATLTGAAQHPSSEPAQPDPTNLNTEHRQRVGDNAEKE